MSWFRRNLGLDWFDLLVHVGVTCMLMAWVGMSHGPDELFPVITGASLIVLAVRRSIALRSAARTGLTTGEMEAERIGELEQRVAELEASQAHVADLAERLDFAERLLAQSAPPLRVVGPGEER
ncbi:MAG TPA: hypothetical protein VFU23_05830 [Gemmatimonadales bacterium]|nr:hypothetical protein [Gemmatimonadales bacterium]